MSRRWATVLLTMGATIGVVALAAALRHNETPDDELAPVVTALWGDAYLLLGGFLLWRRPALIMPRVLLALGGLLAVTAIAGVAATAYPATPAWADGFGAALYVGLGTAMGLLVHLFPTGRAPSAAWGRLVRVLEASSVGLIVGQLLRVDPRGGGPIVAFLAIVLSVGYAVGLISAVPSLAYRVWHARGVERAQLKWFLAAVLVSLGWFTGTAIGALVAIVLPPLAIAFALTRYRLYDIDRIISRTTSYAIVTATLLATYGLLVTAVPNLVPVSSNLAVATATLAAAALARPLFRRVQSLVDRRFNRAHYNGQHTIDAFGARLRHEVDTGVVAGDLVAVVHESLQPERVGLWVRRA